MKRNDSAINKKELKSKRIFLRKNSTSAEMALWNLIKNKQIDGKKFRRQQSIENYIVDFYCPSEKLIIELDGDYHGDYIQIEKDAIRDRFLENKGFVVLRFENRFIFKDPDYVISEIKKTFKPSPELSNQTTRG